MSAKKMIQINPNFLKIGKGRKSTRRKRDHKKDLRASIKPNNIKKKLMSKIKDHHHRSLDTKNNKDETVKFTSDFNDQLGYLEKIIASKKKKKRRRRTKKDRNKLDSITPPQSLNQNPTPAPSIQLPQQISIPVPINPPAAVQHHPSIGTEPKYGCLKNGTKPTYSQYRKTLKKQSHSELKKPKIKFTPLSTPSTTVIERKSKLAMLKKRLATPKPLPIKKFKKRTRTVKIYRLGKNKKAGVVGVLIKSGKTRKIVKDEQDTLRSRCLTEVKQYLRKHNLIKAGTTAPEDILRKLYEDSFLAGNIFNKNPEYLLDNYLNKQLDN